MQNYKAPADKAIQRTCKSRKAYNDNETKTFCLHEWRAILRHLDYDFALIFQHFKTLFNYIS